MLALRSTLTLRRLVVARSTRGDAIGDWLLLPLGVWTETRRWAFDIEPLLMNELARMLPPTPPPMTVLLFVRDRLADDMLMSRGVVGMELYGVLE